MWPWGGVQENLCISVLRLTLAGGRGGGLQGVFTWVYRRGVYSMGMHIGQGGAWVHGVVQSSQGCAWVYIIGRRTTRVGQAT